MAKATGLAARSDLLERRTETVPQVRLRRAERLRNMLMERIWGESAPETAPPPLSLDISGALRQKLSDGWMLEDDIIATVAYCEESGRKIVNQADGSFRGHHAIGHLTYWVAYEKRAQGYLLRDAYSHRMMMKEE